jgi:hypothetical protein
VCCKNEDEDAKNEIVSGKRSRECPIVFQLRMGEDKEKHDVTSTNIRFDEKSRRSWTRSSSRAKLMQH